MMERQLDAPGQADRRPARRLAHRHRQGRAAARARRPARRRPTRVESSQPSVDAATIELSVDLPDARSGSCADPPRAGAGGQQPAQQRRQVHAERRPDPASRCGAQAMATRWCRWPTTASASRHDMLDQSSSCSPRSNARSTARRAASASGCPWCAGWSSCTAARSTRRATGPTSGSTFTVRLPAADAAAGRSSATRRRAPGRDAACACWSSTTTRRRRHAGDAAQERGHQTRVDYSGADALKPRPISARGGLLRHRHGRHGRHGSRRSAARDARFANRPGRTHRLGRRRRQAPHPQSGFDFHLTKPVSSESVQSILARI